MEEVNFFPMEVVQEHKTLMKARSECQRGLNHRGGMGDECVAGVSLTLSTTPRISK